MKKNSPIIVLGMSHSGASAVAGALAKLGVFFGPEEEFPEPESDSLRGRFEQRALTHLNHRCLASFQMNPTSVAQMPVAWRNYPQAQTFRKELTDYLSGCSQNQIRWGIKQPAVCLLTPLYEEVFEQLGVVPHYVICVRNPILLSESMEGSPEPGSRPGPVAVGTWLSYTLGALAVWGGKKSSLVIYNDFVEDPETILRRIVREHAEWSPSGPEFAEAIDRVRDKFPIDSDVSESLDSYPGLVRETFDACSGLGRGEDIDGKLQSLVQEFSLWREMLASPAPQGAKLGFAWVEHGATRVAQEPYLPAGDWQTVRLAVDAPQNTLLSGLLYERPCRIWIRRCDWLWNGNVEPAKLTPGPGSRLTNSDGILRLDGAYESNQVATMTPQRLGPYVLELEFLLEAGLQINVETANRISDRLQKCAATYDALSLRVNPRETAAGPYPDPKRS